ncbi:PQQ-dependent sugar dehydrogenase [Herbaspirillum sp. GCM10030257]|uniref:PQQ-dependent sugar dehydrogenase n=1 Tax=Herbaspirillum sp. GCM10030257 TaxID=3273393 RepID=UPI00360CA649
MPNRRNARPWLLTGAFLLSCLTGAHAAGVKPEVLTDKLEHPWGLAFIGQGRMLVTERPGRMRLIESNGKAGPPIAGLPEVDVGGQGGLLDVQTDSGFSQNRIIYFCYAEPAKSGGGNSTALASARLSDDGKKLEQVKVVFSQKPKTRSDAHFGCRIVEAKDGTLFLTLGDRYKRKDDAQTLDNHHGKVVRINKDGSVPKNNPFVGKAGALPEIWSYGHRNSQGAALGPDGRLWIHEHAAQGGDEVNRPEAGKNYGWPVISWGLDYGGGKIGEGLNEKEGMEQPVYYWNPSIAPSGMVFLRSDRYGKEWQGNLFVGALKLQYLARLVLQGDKVVKEEKLLQDVTQRIRDVREGPDGLLYVLTDHDNGQLIRLQPVP